MVKKNSKRVNVKFLIGLIGTFVVLAGILAFFASFSQDNLTGNLAAPSSITRPGGRIAVPAGTAGASANTTTGVGSTKNKSIAPYVSLANNHPWTDSATDFTCLDYDAGKNIFDYVIIDQNAIADTTYYAYYQTYATTRFTPSIKSKIKVTYK